MTTWGPAARGSRPTREEWPLAGPVRGGSAITRIRRQGRDDRAVSTVRQFEDVLNRHPAGRIGVKDPVVPQLPVVRLQVLNCPVVHLDGS